MQQCPPGLSLNDKLKYSFSFYVFRYILDAVRRRQIYDVNVSEEPLKFLNFEINSREIRSPEYLSFFYRIVGLNYFLYPFNSY